MSRFGHQWRGFAAFANPLLDYSPAPPAEKAPAPVIMLDRLPFHRPPRVGRVCPRCRGQVVATHSGGEPACLQCGHEPPRRRPAAYIFEPYEDNAATARAAFLREDERNGPVTVRFVAEPLAADVCVACGKRDVLKVHRCPECYRDYLAKFRVGVA